MSDCRLAEEVSVVSDSEMMVTFVKLYSEDHARNISLLRDCMPHCILN
jgi:hypothetical protein